MAELKIGFNEGSLLRRTLLHVGTFVVGAVTFIGLMSLLLVTVVKGLLHAPSADGAAEVEAASGAPAKPGTLKPATARKKPAALPSERAAKEE
jgi:type III secretory pathway component EscV